jgi:6,7-dimethyl-8-ribityllumazine synthase
MSGAGAPQLLVGDLSGVRVAVIASSWHDVIMDGLIANAMGVCADAGVDATLVRVPGSFELGVAAMRAARAGFDAVVALGVIIRGGTPHFEFVASATTDALNRVGLDTGFGVLTCDDEAQALDRAGLPRSAENKGREAAEAALSMVQTMRSLGW